MVKEIIWSETSIKDRFEIYTFWAEHNKSDTYSKKLETLFNQTAQLLSNFPEIGLSTDFKSTKIKIVSQFKIFYLIKKDSIIILRIWDARQNPKKFKLK
jgi:plasmid stabilization system protein ParE